MSPNPSWLRKFVRALPVRVLRRGVIRYDDDGLISLHDDSFRRRPRFSRAYSAGRATGSWGGADIHWRAHVACWAGSIGVRLPGDFVECGVNRGGLARAVCDYVNLAQTGKRFWLLDTYEGLDPAKLRSDEQQRAGRWSYSPCHEDVVRTFADVPGARIVRGAVPDTLAHVKATQVAYLSIDMNCVEPEVAALRHFWPHLAIGACVLLDDYGWAGHEAQRDAFDALAAELGFEILSLPTGQGLIIRAP